MLAFAYGMAATQARNCPSLWPLVFLGIRLAVAVVALRQPRRVQRRNGSHGPRIMRQVFAPLDAALLVAARRVLPR